MFKRKILAAILSSILFALAFSLPEFGFNAEYANFFFNLYYLNLLLVGTYGIVVSLFSDWVSSKLWKKKSGQELTSFLLHCLFGLVFFTLSLVSACAFFIVDRLLKKLNIRWWLVLTSLATVAVVFVLLITFLP